ncbi:hypothetical protein K504DRAFT_373109, partial [Pleomassaria siparia CBS 279.74]
VDPPDMWAHHLSDDESGLFDTPAVRKNKKDGSASAGEGAATGKTRTKESHYTTEEAREAALRKELETVRNVNKVIEGVVESLEKARSNMDTVSRTVHNASTLLQTWTRILSQTEHNQRLLLNPQWQGASQDLVDIQDEEAQRQHAAQRRAADDQARREAAARRAEEERRRAENPTKAGTRGRGRGGVRPRGAPAASSGYGVSGQRGRGVGGSSTAGRAGTGTGTGTGIGRGMRARGRGLG